MRFLRIALVVLALTSCQLPAIATPPSASWPTHAGRFFSFRYPDGWRVEDDGSGQYIALYPPQGDSRRKIEIAYLGREIDADENLLAWLRAYTRAARGEPLPEIRVLHEETSPRADGSQRRLLHTAAVTETEPSQAVSITYGRLVLSIGTYTHEEAAADILRRIAESLEFTSDAPATLDELRRARGAQ